MTIELELTEFIEKISETEDACKTAIFNQFQSQFEPGSISLLLESLPIEQRILLWRQLPLNDSIEVLSYMRSEPRHSIIGALSEQELKLIFSQLDDYTLIEWADTLPEELLNLAISYLDHTQWQQYQEAITYNELQIGRYAQRNCFILPVQTTVGHARLYLKKQGYKYPDQIYVKDKKAKFLGVISYQVLTEAAAHEPLKPLIDDHIPTLTDKLSINEALEVVESSNYIALPVINDVQHLLGEIDYRFAMSSLRQHYEQQLMAGAGLNEGDDLFAPIKQSTQKRAVWLGINLITAILASITISLFEDVIAEVVALAVLMPIVASMGGIAGSQTLTLMIRAMALNQITPGNRLAVLKNECGIGSLNGLLWALIIGLLAGVWFQSVQIAAILSLAIVVNIFVAALFGVLIPIFLNKCKLDPALAGSVILTTVTDVVGFFAFLGTASLILLR